MTEKKDSIGRREFLKTIGAAGIGSVFISSDTCAEPNEPNAAEPNGVSGRQESKLPLRKLGKTAALVPCLALGLMFNAVEKQILLRKALEWSVSYWDTAYSYAGGNSELGIGKFLSANPQVRSRLFIATKASWAKKPGDVRRRLRKSLKRMKTDYVDLYYAPHGLDDPADLTDELRRWAEKARKSGLIRYFGFTTHKNMADCLLAASKLDWIDVVMTSYNFRLMQNAKMQSAVDACYKVGIGLVAMKVQAKQIETEDDRQLAGHFLKRGFTAGQAKTKIVLDDERITAACLGGDNIGHLLMNVAAAMDKTKLSQADRDILNRYAQSSCSGYCAGCGNICERASGMPYISEVMRYLMYYNSYGQQRQARGLFARIPAEVRDKLLKADYRPAEARCPQTVGIGRFVAEAASKLA